MGCDGGTIPRRDELVRVKKKPEQKDKEAERSFKWRNCALSQQKLQEPIVACALGRLYTKSCVLEALLDKANKPESISHIKNLKDIKELKLTNNPAYVNADRSSSMVDERSAPYICPLIGLEMQGNFRFIALWSCGCVFSERALKEVKQNLCHQCQQSFTDNDVVVLNGTDEDIEQLKVKMAARNANRKGKKVKSEKSETITLDGTINKISTSSGSNNEVATSSSSNNEVATSSSSKCETVISGVKEENDPQPGSSGTKVKEETDPVPLGITKNKGKHPPPRGHFGSSKRAPGTELVDDPSYKKTKKDYSVASDPKSSEVYKSLFTSHKSEKEQTRAHWVTYNPFYN